MAAPMWKLSRVGTGRERLHHESACFMKENLDKRQLPLFVQKWACCFGERPCVWKGCLHPSEVVSAVSSFALLQRSVGWTLSRACRRLLNICFRNVSQDSRATPFSSRPKVTSGPPEPLFRLCVGSASKTRRVVPERGLRSLSPPGEISLCHPVWGRKQRMTFQNKRWGQNPKQLLYPKLLM